MKQRLLSVSCLERLSVSLSLTEEALLHNIRDLPRIGMAQPWRSVARPMERSYNHALSSDFFEIL